MNEKLYWTDNCDDEIEVYDLATQKRKSLINTGTNPFAIVVDPEQGYVCMCACVCCNSMLRKTERKSCQYGRFNIAVLTGVPR